MMLFRLLITASVMFLLRGYAQAAPIQLVFPSATYQSGSSLLFYVVLPVDINNLGAYEIQILLTGDDPTAGIDYGFDIDATEAANAQYVFDSTDLFFDTTLSESPTSQILLLTDLTLGAGIDVTQGINDRVAIVVVHTSANYQGRLHFAIDPDSLILDTSNGDEIDGLAVIRSDTASSPPTTLVVVPEPTAIVILAIATLFTARRIRRRQKIPSSHRPAGPRRTDTGLSS